MRSLSDSLLAGLPAAIVLLVFTASGLLLCHGCEPDVSVDSALSLSESPDMMQGVFDFETCLSNGDCYSGVRYDNASSVGSAKIALSYQDRRINSHTDVLEAMGYVFAPDRSTYVISETLDGVPFWIVSLMFDGQAAVGETNRALVRYLSVRGEGDNLQTEQWFAGSNPTDYWLIGGVVECLGFDPIGRLVWTQSYEPEIRKFVHDAYGSPVLDPPEPEVNPEYFDFWKWLKCVSHESTIGCAVGAGACLMAPGDYDECSEELCARAVIGAAIGCALTQYYDN